LWKTINQPHNDEQHKCNAIPHFKILTLNEKFQTERTALQYPSSFNYRLPVRNKQNMGRNIFCERAHNFFIFLNTALSLREGVKSKAQKKAPTAARLFILIITCQ
jgi:hypothetical protein